MRSMVPLSVPNMKGNELKYVTQAIETEWVSTSGSFINQFEKNASAYVKSSGAVACQSGTAGIHIALNLLGVLPGDEVIVPTLTFIAAVNPVKYVGANPIFMDCDETLTMDVQKLKMFCRDECTFNGTSLINNKTKRVIRAIIVVHVFGNMCDMESIIELSKKYKLKVIEDATEALGTYYIEGPYKGKHAGTIGDIGIYSFNGNKIITTGGGGMIVSQNEEFLERAKYLTTQAKDDVENYIHHEVGYNYRMTNVQAAIGLAQLEQLESFIEIKKRNYERYVEGLRKSELFELLAFRDDIRPNYWFYSLICQKTLTLKKDEVIQNLKENKIQTRPIWGLISQQKPYLKNQSYEIECAKEYSNRIVNIPCSSNLLEEDVDYVIACINKL